MPVVVNDTLVLNPNGEAGAPSGICGRGLSCLAFDY